MWGTLEWAEAREHGRWLNQLNMFVQALWKTVIGCSDDALAAVLVSIDVIFLSSL